MSENTSGRTSAEKITLVFSLLVLVLIVSLAAWANAQVGNKEPLIEVEIHLENTRETDSGYYVPITVVNSGGLTAQDVVVTGELDIGEDEPQTAEITITYLAGGESAEAELVFSSNPREGDLTVDPTSFVYP